MEVDFSKSQATAQRPLILTEDHISVDDLDTRDVDASRTKFRITGLTGGALHERADTGTSTPWTQIVADGSNAYLEFTLADLQGGLVAFVPDASASPLAFDIQAHDGTHLSDSDRSTSDPDPESVSVSVVALRTVAAGEEVSINGDGALTPNIDTLDAWLVADDSLKIFVVLGGGKEGIITLAAGLVQERLSVGTHSVSDSKIAVSWDAKNWRLSLTGTDTATRADFQEVLNALQLQTVHFGQVSHRTISVQPDITRDISKKNFHVREVQVSASLPNPILEVAFEKLRVNADARQVLATHHILVKDLDTVLGNGNTDASRITLRVSGVSGGTLQSRASASADWGDMTLVTGETYYAFTLADLQAGKVAFLAGDGVASADGGAGTKITFQIQAADDGDGTPGSPPHLSDSDPTTSDLEPVDGEISIVMPVEATTGYGAPVNGDEVLSPLAETLTYWKRSAKSHGGTMRVVARIVDKQEGDKLSLEGYVESKVTSGWNGVKGELSLELAVGATVQDMREALRTLWLDTSVSLSASTREIWVFPTVAGVNGFAHHVDKSEKVARYYLYDGTGRTFADATTVASGRSLFGEEGYLGVYLSDAERAVYVDIRRGNIHLAISDEATEGTWVITSGPREGEVLWDHSGSKYGPGARGSDWGTFGNFWTDGTTITGSHDYAKLNSGDTKATSGNARSWETRHSITHFDLLLSKGAFLSRGVNLAKSPSNPILEVDFDRLHVDSGQRLVLTEKHISVYDPDTADASSVWLRVTGLTGGELQRRSSSSESVWTKIVAGGKAYLEFTLEQLRAERIAILAGDGLASGEGEKIVFQVQAADAADDTANLSDFNPLTPDKDPVGADIVVVIMAKATAGFRESLNADEALTPDEATLTVWKQEATTHSGTLHVIVRLGNMQDGDILSLPTGYDASKVTPRWDQDKGELSLEIASGATEADIQAALKLLELDTEVAGSVSTRKVWIFPTLSGVSGFRYRVDESAGLVRYYFYDSTGRTFSAASTEAAGRSLFGKSGYLGVFTSNAERIIYKALRQHDMHLAISDDTQLGTTEGKWMITAGPRQDQVLWDHTSNPKVYGPGAEGSGWTERNDFWSGGDPDNWGLGGQDYPIMRSDGLVRDGEDGSRRSISHHDLWLSKGEIFARLVKVAESPPNPVLRVDFKFQVTAQRPLILTEDHLSVKDIDTRDPLDDTKVDASKIKFRITNIAHGTLHERADTGTSTPWTQIVADGSNAYLEFTLAQLQGGLVAFVPDASASPLAFDIQAHDGTHLSDFDLSTSDADPTSVTAEVVALKEIDAGKEMPVNDDRRATSGDGALTPSSATLDAWISAAASNQRVLVRIEGTKRGETLFLKSGHGVGTITSSWSWDEDTAIGTLSLQSDGTATLDDFQAVLNALALRTVRSGSASIRTISVRPDIAAEVPQKDYYTRDVLIRRHAAPYVGVQKLSYLKFGTDDRAILSPSEFLVEDFDTSPSDVTIVMRSLLSGAELHKSDGSGGYTSITPESDGSYGVQVGGFTTRVDCDIFTQSAGREAHLRTGSQGYRWQLERCREGQHA